MNKTIGPGAISGIKNVDVVFDANVWIFVMTYCNAQEHKTAVYSEIQKHLLAADCKIIVLKEVIFEVFNRCIKYEFDIICEQDPSLRGRFKEFRSSEVFRDTMEGVRDTCLNIIDDYFFVETNHTTENLSSFINEAGKGHLDCTDLIIENYCRSNGSFLATDDKDFIMSKIDIITANNNIIRGRGTTR
jgi:hypothetical protein